MNKKSSIIAGSVIAVVAVVALIIYFTGRKEAYRSIKIFEIDGSCKVERNGDSLDAFKDMELSSGDTLTVEEGSFVRLILDDDKYVYLEANTKINLTATGTTNDSKTIVYIEYGSMLTEVKKKLSATSSYDIVTPNTIMSIRGTKTLTQVLENAVTGHIRTNNAVLEGQVKLRSVKVKADGTAVLVEKYLGPGEGSAFSSNKENLVSSEDMKFIADTGTSVNGIRVKTVSEKDADVVFDSPTFEAPFLENVKNVLVADAQAEIGEEGLSQEQIDEINARINEVIIAVDAISADSRKAIAVASSNNDNQQSPRKATPEPAPENASESTPQNTPEPTPKIVPEPAPKNTSESTPAITPAIDGNREYTPVAETDDTPGESTTPVTGNTNPPVIGDDEAEVYDFGDNGGVNSGNNEAEGQSDEPTGETTNPSGGQNSDPTNTSDTGTSVNYNPHDSSTEIAEQGSGSSTETQEPETVNIAYGSTTAYVSSSPDSDNWTEIRLRFYTIRGTEFFTLEQGNLPTNLAIGDPLPGTENSTILVEFDTESAEFADYYEFAGWYKSESGAKELNSREFLDTAQENNVTIYPGVRAKTSN